MIFEAFTATECSGVVSGDEACENIVLIHFGDLFGPGIPFEYGSTRLIQSFGFIANVGEMIVSFDIFLTSYLRTPNEMLVVGYEFRKCGHCLFKDNVVAL